MFYFFEYRNYDKSLGKDNGINVQATLLCVAYLNILK